MNSWQLFKWHLRNKPGIAKARKRERKNHSYYLLVTESSGFEFIFVTGCKRLCNRHNAIINLKESTALNGKKRNKIKSVLFLTKQQYKAS